MNKCEKQVFVLITAAGKGTRMNMEIFKQYIEIDGIPILARTIQAFQDCEMVDDIILVVNPDDIVYCKKNIVDLYGFDKVSIITAGGKTRQQSVYNGLKQINEKNSIILIHDGVRPFISEDSIIKCIEAAVEFGGACVAVPVKDTVKSVNEEGFIDKTLDRSRLWSVQTPQAFRYEMIYEAYRSADEVGFIATDDAMVAERLGHMLKIVQGSYFNIKITTEEDLILAEAIAARDI